MQIALIIISILLIALTLLQSGKADNGNGVSALTGGNSDLFKNRKERGGELFITRLTFVLGVAFFAICIIIGF